MENHDFIKYIEDIKNLMTQVGTGQADIMKVDDHYKTIYITLAREFRKRGIENKNDYLSLWDFYNFWKENGFTTYQSRRNHIRELYKHVEYDILVNNRDGGETVEDSGVLGYSYFSNEKIEELQKQRCKFDLSKLIQILKEINVSYKQGCYLSVSVMLRMFIDHIPPIFLKQSFSEVVNNFSFTKSDKQNMLHLLGGLKNIADGNLHTQISTKEILPTKHSIEFRADFDVLLKNIILELSKI